MNKKKTEEKGYEKFVNRIVELGAVEAKIISPCSVVTAAWVRMKCQFGCGGYGVNLCCPPYTACPDETRRVLDCYENALLARFDGEVNVTGAMAKLEREAFLADYYKAFSYGAGPCSLCKPCDLKECKHTGKRRPSMECSGIDVFTTARNNGFPIVVLDKTSCKGNFYGLLLLE